MINTCILSDHCHFITLDSKFGSSPVSSLGIVSDLVPGLEPEPLRHGPVLIDLFREDFLDPE